MRPALPVSLGATQGLPAGLCAGRISPATMVIMQMVLPLHGLALAVQTLVGIWGPPQTLWPRPSVPQLDFGPGPLGAPHALWGTSHTVHCQSLRV